MVSNTIRRVVTVGQAAEASLLDATSHYWSRLGQTLIKAGVIGGVLVASAYIGRRSPAIPYRYLALLGIAAFSLFVLQNMSAALTLLVAASPLIGFSIGTGTQSPINLTMLMVAGLTGLWALRMLVQERRVWLVPSELNGPLLIFLVIAAVSWLGGYAIWDINVPRPANALFVQAGQYAMFALSAAAFLLTANHRLTDRTLKGWTLLIVAIGVWGMIYTWLRWRRPEAFSGALLMWPFVLVFGQLLYNPKLKAWLRLLGWMMMALWPLWVLTRISLAFKGGWVPALLAIALLALLHSRRASLVFIVAGALVVGLLVAVRGVDYLQQQVIFSETYTGSGLRSAIWLDVIRLGARSFFLGLGPANYMYYWSDPSFEPVSEALWGHFDPRFIYSPPSHNMFVDIFAQTGLIGLLLFTWAMVAALRLGWRLRRRFPAGFRRAHVYSVLCGFTSMVFSSFIFADWLLPFVYNVSIRGFRHSVYSWLLLGTLVSLDYFTREVSDEPAS